MTTIPPRLHEIGSTIESLLAQTANIASVQLWIPRKYRRTEFQQFTMPKMPKGVEVMYCDFDYGPATKVLPAAKKYKGEDLNIIYCDDDEYYDADWADLLFRTSLERPNSCVATCGLNVDSVKYEAHVNGSAFKFLSVMTVDFYRKYYKKKYRWVRPGVGFVDIAQGFGGVLVRPAFFDESAYEIPDILWTVDDIWLSGQMCKNGIEIYRASEKKKCHKTNSASVAALSDLTYRGFDRNSADLKCVNYFRENFAIWNGT